MPEPTTRFSGIKSARYRPAGDTDWNNETDLGDLHDDSQVEYELPEDDQTTLGESPYAGQFKNVTVKSFKMGAYSALYADYKADNRIDLELTLMEGETLLIEDVLPRVMKDPREGSAGGRNTFTLEPTKFSL